jgi:hypothetical protein
MTLRERIAKRLRATPACLRNDDKSREVYGPWQDAADLLAAAFTRGDFDGLLGVAEPTLEDVKAEARRVFGNSVRVDSYGASVYVTRRVPDGVRVYDEHLVVAPTIASAYQALRALPTKVET